MIKTSQLIIVLFAILVACTNNSQTFVDPSSVIDDGIILSFIENPSSLLAGQEYKIDITHEDYGRKELIISVNNGSIKRLKPNEIGDVLYNIKPSKTGALKLIVFRNVDGEMKEVGFRKLMIE